ncbi:uncharacterized protein LOC108050444 [Drosophila rhopaloa]|uniref:MADF domain-containing protein n=2 Tax=Drosophila rhopaloa TaxID=1041015 RepID=A0ABM5J499_DRORH|nr:uncharacterized protein LOC108050444 [Drosophila rhopaloa]
MLLPLKNLQHGEDDANPNRSASSCSMTPTRNHSSRISSIDSQEVGVIRPTPESVTFPKTPNPAMKHRKSRGFLSFLFGKRFQKTKKQDQVNGNHFYLKEHDIRRLIRLYCKYDNLYDQKNPYYGNEETDEDCYNYLARSFPGITSSELRSCLEELRMSFEREYTIIERARRNSGEIMKPSIWYYNEFLFLVPYLCIDFEKDLLGSGNSLLSIGRVLSTDPKNQMVTTKILSHNLTNFTGFPLAAFPGNLSCCRKIVKQNSDMELQKQSKITEQGDPEKEKEIEQEAQDAQKKEKPNDQEHIDEKSLNEQEDQKEKISEQEDQQQKVSFSPTSEQKAIYYSEEDASQNKSISKVSTQSSYYANERDLKTTDLICSCQSDGATEKRAPTSESSQKPVACPWRPKNSPCVPQCQVTGSQPNVKSQLSSSPPENSPRLPKSQDTGSEPTQNHVACPWQPKNSGCVSECLVDLPGSSPEPSIPVENKASDQSGKSQQVQMLCDMIRTELTDAPEFIYFDAKWRIIEILRDVHKRQLVDHKGKAQGNPRRPMPPKKRTSGETNLTQKYQQYKLDRSTQEKGITRICDHLKCSHCPYCCRHN